MLMENDVVRMPSWMVALPCITMLMASNMLMVEGELFLEVFSGSGIVSLGMMLAAVPLWRPWDVKYGEPFCVQQHGWLLLKMAEQGKISSCHMGTPCGSGTMARDVQLRSWEEPYGVIGLGTYHAEIVKVGNRLIEFSVKFCTALWKGGSYFSIENPWPCWTWVHPWMVALWKLTGVIFTTFVMQRFKAPYEKLSGLLHNYPFGWMLGRMRDHSAAVTPLRGKVKVGNEWVFRTRLAEVYPMDFGTQYGQMAAKSLEYRKRCIQQHLPVRMTDASMDGFPHHFDRSQLEEVWLQGRCDDGSGTTFVPYGNGAVAGFTKQEHMAWGKAQPHPLDTPLI